MSADTFETRLNPLIPVGRFMVALFMLGMSAFGVHFLQQANGADRTGFLFFALFSLCLAFVFSKRLLTQTKIYTISYKEIVVTDYLTFRTYTLLRDEILGYSRSVIWLRVGTFQQITLHLSEKRSLCLPQFSYFNFKRIEPALVESNYPNLTAAKRNGNA